MHETDSWFLADNISNSPTQMLNFVFEIDKSESNRLRHW